MLKYLMENGNSTTYQWRTGEKPEVIEEAKIFIDTSDENEVVQVTDDVSLLIIIYFYLRVTLSELLCLQCKCRIFLQLIDHMY